MTETEAWAAHLPPHETTEPRSGKEIAQMDKIDTSTGLEPCPFCGVSAHMRRELCTDGGGYFAYIQCNGCRSRSCETYYSAGNDCQQTYQGRRDAWNRRALVPALSAENADLRAKLDAAVEALEHAKLNMPHPDQLIDATLAKIKGADHE